MHSTIGSRRRFSRGPKTEPCQILPLPTPTLADPVDIILNLVPEIPTFQLVRLRDVFDIHLEERALANGEVA